MPPFIDRGLPPPFDHIGACRLLDDCRPVYGLTGRHAFTVIERRRLAAEMAVDLIHGRRRALAGRKCFGVDFCRAADSLHGEGLENQLALTCGEAETGPVRDFEARTQRRFVAERDFQGLVRAAIAQMRPSLNADRCPVDTLSLDLCDGFVGGLFQSHFRCGDR